MFDDIVGHFESSQGKESGCKPVILIKLMKDEVSEKDGLLSLFYSFPQQELLDEKEAGLGQILSHLARFSHWEARDVSSLRDSLGSFAKYLVDNFFLPRKVPGYTERTRHSLPLIKALAVETPQPTPAISRSKTPNFAIGTPQRVSNLRRGCLYRDRHRCVVTRKFDAQIAQVRYKRDGRDIKDDDGTSLIPERDGCYGIPRSSPYNTSLSHVTNK